MISGPNRPVSSALGSPCPKGAHAHAPFLTVLLIGFLAVPGQAAGAQGPCDQRDAVLGLLADRFQERPVAIGVTSEGNLVEVLTDADGGTWTIIVTSPDGESCLILSGEGWRTTLRLTQEPEA